MSTCNVVFLEFVGEFRGNFLRNFVQNFFDILMGSCEEVG